MVGVRLSPPCLYHLKNSLTFLRFFVKYTYIHKEKQEEILLKRFFVFLLVFCLFMTSFSVCAQTTLNTVTLSSQTVTTFGRTYYGSNGTDLNFNWSNSGFQFTFTGTTVSGVFSAMNSVSSGTYINVFVDDNAPVTLTLPNRKNNTVVLAEGLENKTHRVRVVKRSENSWGGTVSVSNLLTDGTMGTPPQNAQRKIEVIGDSITCGFGNLVTADTAAGGYLAKEQDGTNTFATLAASYFGADCQVIARSGIGFSCDSGGNKNLLMSHIYPYTDYLSGGGTSSPAWDFNANPSDVVILALGTNDTANSDSADYEAKAREMLALVREKNPNSHIIWAYGMMTASRGSIIKQVVQEANNNGDSKVYYHGLTLQTAIENGVGGGGHPGMECHVYNSKTLAALIAQVTGWKTITPVEYESSETAEGIMLYDGESTEKITPAYSTKLSLDTQCTQGNTSLKMNYTTAIGQTNKIGGMAIISLSQPVDLSDAQTVTFDLYLANDLVSSHGFQVNFATVGQDGYNTIVALNDRTQGWHSFTINLAAVSPAVSTADWSSIAKIRVTWMNYVQAGPTYFLLDNMKAQAAQSGTVQLPYEAVTDPNRQAAERVTQQIASLQVDNQQSVLNTRAAYEALTDIQKSMVPSIQKLVDAEAAFAQKDADQQAANQVMAAIDALTGEDPQAIQAARTAYDSLTDTQKQLVTNLAKLEQWEQQPSPKLLYGDVNQDQSINAKDALMILKSAVGKIVLTESQQELAELNGDGAINAKDALLVLQKSVGKIETFPIEK